MARERGHEVQIVGNFFLEEKKKNFLSRFFSFSSHTHPVPLERVELLVSYSRVNIK